MQVNLKISSYLIFFKKEQKDDTVKIITKNRK